MSAHEKLLALIAARDARDEIERAAGWIVQTTHADGLGGLLSTHGTFQEPAAALAWADRHLAGLNVDGEEGFRCTVRAVMPAN